MGGREGGTGEGERGERGEIEREREEREKGGEPANQPPLPSPSLHSPSSLPPLLWRGGEREKREGRRASQPTTPPFSLPALSLLSRFKENCGESGENLVGWLALLSSLPLLSRGVKGEKKQSCTTNETDFGSIVKQIRLIVGS